MKAKELREMTDVELNKQLKDLKAELFNLRFQHAINQLDNPVRIDAVKKDIARVMTIMAEKNVKNGKGSPEYWVAVVKPGRVLFELADVDEATARESLRLASNKLPIRCKFVKREELDTVKEGDAE